MEHFKALHLPCGGTAYFDESSGCSHRCADCMATVGSIGMPQSCKDAVKFYDSLKAVGFKTRWDYTKGCEVEDGNCNHSVY